MVHNDIIASYILPTAVSYADRTEGRFYANPTKGSTIGIYCTTQTVKSFPTILSQDYHSTKIIYIHSHNTLEQGSDIWYETRIFMWLYTRGNSIIYWWKEDALRLQVFVWRLPRSDEIVAYLVDTGIFYTAVAAAEHKLIRVPSYVTAVQQRKTLAGR